MWNLRPEYLVVVLLTVPCTERAGPHESCPTCTGNDLPAAGAEVVPPREGIWTNAEELGRIPITGAAWVNLLAASRQPLPPADLGPRDSLCDVLVMARALVYARTGSNQCRDDVLVALDDVIGTEEHGDVLSLSRNLPGYVIAAELVDPPLALELRLRTWLATLRDAPLGGTTMRKIHELRPNNWGTHAGGARAVIARYLGDEQDLARVAHVLRTWLGEDAAHRGFEFGRLDWQADPTRPVGITPAGATWKGHSIDGVLPDDQRRAGGFAWPPPRENYVYEALQGALLQALVLSRAGYDAWEWGDRALLRAALWLEDAVAFPATGDDTWQPYVLNAVYGSSLRTVTPARPGKSVGWTDWTLGTLEPR